jgi:hypothetical protein
MQHADVMSVLIEPTGSSLTASDCSTLTGGCPDLSLLQSSLIVGVIVWLCLLTFIVVVSIVVILACPSTSILSQRSLLSESDVNAAVEVRSNSDVITLAFLT